MLCGSPNHVTRGQSRGNSTGNVDPTTAKDTHCLKSQKRFTLPLVLWYQSLLEHAADAKQQPINYPPSSTQREGWTPELRHVIPTTAWLLLNSSIWKKSIDLVASGLKDCQTLHFQHQY